jgi:hypothetical protein
MELPGVKSSGGFVRWDQIFDKSDETCQNPFGSAFVLLNGRIKEI